MRFRVSVLHGNRQGERVLAAHAEREFSRRMRRASSTNASVFPQSWLTHSCRLANTRLTSERACASCCKKSSVSRLGAPINVTGGCKAFVMHFLLYVGNGNKGKQIPQSARRWPGRLPVLAYATCPVARHANQVQRVQPRNCRWLVCMRHASRESLGTTA